MRVGAAAATMLLLRLLLLQSNVPGQEQIWTTSPALRSVLSSNSLEANVKVTVTCWCS
jgi:hypothetical protein